MADSIPRTHRVNLDGDLEKRVSCEACSRDYFHVVKREALGSHIDFLVLDAAQVEGMAGDDARQKVARALAGLIEIVPCPHCGHVQREMLPLVRDTYYPHMRYLAFAMLFLAALIGAVAIVVADRARIGMLPQWAWIVCGALVIGGFLILVLRGTIASREDPNAESLEERLKLGRSRGVPE